MLLPGRAQRMTGAQLFAGFASCVLLQLGFAGYAAQSVSRAFLCAKPPLAVVPSARCGIGLLKKQKGTRPIFL
jgi:hypothetical protein